MSTLTITVALVLAITLGVARAHYDWEKAEKAFNDCKAETNAEESFVDVVKKEIIPTSENGKCLVDCILKWKGITDKDGKYSKEGSKNYFSQVYSHNTALFDKAVAITEECSKIGNDSNKCQAAVNYVSCAKAKFMEHKINVHE